MKRIAIHSVPRSGSTWLGSIFDSHPDVVYKLQPLFSYAFKNRLGSHSIKADIDQFFSELADSEDDFINQREGKSKGIIPQFPKGKARAIVYKEVRYHHILKNLLEKDADIRIIGLVRNPLSVISSWLKAPKEFRPDLGWQVEEEWRFAPKKNLDKVEEYNGFEKWKEATLLFEELQQKYPERFYLLRYSDLLHDTREEVKRLFEFSGLEMHPQTIDFIEASTSTSVKDAYGVYRKKKADDQWKADLPEYIQTEIRTELEGTPLEKYLME